MKKLDFTKSYLPESFDEISNFQNEKALPGIDLRADGGYVVAPPSVHPN